MKLKKVFKVIGIVLGAIVALALLFVLYVTIREYKPDDVEASEVTAPVSKAPDGGVKEGGSYTIMTWNTGYGALDETADFFMDGGEHVTTATKEKVQENMAGITATISDVDPDFLMLQECDVSSKRSHYIDEPEYLRNNLTDYYSCFAYNYKAPYVPYPIPTIGKVSAGIMTFSLYEETDAERIALYCPFKYPISTCNLKRCLLVSRVKVEGTDRELVLINLHLEAYDSGEGKIRQTEQLKEVIETEIEKGNYVIAGGDFNQIFSNADSSRYPQVSEDMWVPGVIDTEDFDSSLQFIMDSDTASCRSLDKVYKGADKDNFQYFIIDGFIVSGNITVNDYGIDNVDFKYSDHNPLVMNFTLN